MQVAIFTKSYETNDTVFHISMVSPFEIELEQRKDSESLR